MALNSEIRSKIVRQELDAALVGPSFTKYEAKVKYNPVNIEKDDFFSLCYGMLKVGDEISIHTYQKGKHNCYYKFLVIDVNVEDKIVKTHLLNKFDFMNSETNVKVEGVDTDALNTVVQVMVDAKTQELIKTINELQEKFTKYTTETDDQLEEIENTIADLQEAPAKIAAPDGTEIDLEIPSDETEEDETDEDDGE